jgi:hypothetical protein
LQQVLDHATPQRLALLLLLLVGRLLLLLEGLPLLNGLPGLPCCQGGYHVARHPTQQ